MKQEMIQGDSTAFTVYHDSSAYEWCDYACQGLGAAETVAIARSIAGQFTTVTAYDGPGATNNAVVFTGSGGTPASVSFVQLSGGYYRFTASGDPAGTVYITAEVGPRKV